MSKKVIILSVVGLLVLVGGGIAVAAAMKPKVKPKGASTSAGAGAGTGAGADVDLAPTEPFFAKNEAEAAQMKQLAQGGKFMCTDGQARSAILQGFYVPADANTHGMADCEILHWMAGINSGNLPGFPKKDYAANMKEFAETAAFQRSQQKKDRPDSVINFMF